MAIVIREYLGSPIEERDSSIINLSLSEAEYSLNRFSKDSIMQDIEGIHVGPTRNFTWYTEEALKSSLPTWTHPYRRPLILHHNEKDGKIIGRITAVSYTDVNTRSKTGALVFTCNIADEEGKKGVQDGLLETVSIGVIAHDVRCSICGHIISEHGECEHERGVKYDGEVCYWMINRMEAKELSYVIVPSDIYAHNIRTYSAGNKNLSENFNEGVLSMSKVDEITNDTKKVTEDAKVINEDVKDEKEVIKENGDKAEDNPSEIERLTSEVAVLKSNIEKLKDQLNRMKELKEAAENELIATNTTLKEFAAEQLLMLREQLGRPEISKESLLKRTQESLMDSIVDLKEEANIGSGKSISIKESENNDEQSSEETDSKDTLNSIGKAMSESLLDEEKDSSSKKEEKNIEVDVKENSELSNIDNEVNLDIVSKFYNL